MKKNNAVELTEVIHYQVDSPWPATGGRVLAVAKGQCNGRPFEAILLNDVGLSATASIFHNNDDPFSKSEYQSIRRKMKAEEPTKIVDWRFSEHNAESESPQETLYREYEKKYLGVEIELDVPFVEKDQAKVLGAYWDGLKKKWSVMSKAKNLGEFSRWMSTDQKEAYL